MLTKKKIVPFIYWIAFQKKCRYYPTECLLCARHDATAGGDTETNEISLFSWAHGLMGKTKRHTANSNAM